MPQQGADWFLSRPPVSEGAGVPCCDFPAAPKTLAAQMPTCADCPTCSMGTAGSISKLLASAKHKANEDNGDLFEACEESKAAAGSVDALSEAQTGSWRQGASRPSNPETSMSIA